MDTGADLNNMDVVNDQAFNKTYTKGLFFGEGNPDQLFGELAADVREDLFSYLDRMGLINESGMLVIPSTRHFFLMLMILKG